MRSTRHGPDVKNVSSVRRERGLTAGIIAAIAEVLHRITGSKADIVTSTAALRTPDDQLAPLRIRKILLQQHRDARSLLIRLGLRQKQQLPFAVISAG